MCSSGCAAPTWPNSNEVGFLFASLGRLVGCVHTEQAIAPGNAVALGPLGTLGVVASCIT